MKKLILFFILFFYSQLFAETSTIDQLLQSIENGDRKGMVMLDLPNLYFQQGQIDSKLSAIEFTKLLKQSDQVSVFRNLEIEDSLNINQLSGKKTKLIFINCLFKDKLQINKPEISSHLSFIGCQFNKDVNINDLSIKNLSFVANRFGGSFSCTAAFLKNRIDDFMLALNYMKTFSVEGFNVNIATPYSGTITTQNLTITSNLIEKVFLSGFALKELALITYNIIDQFEANSVNVDYIFLIKYNQITQCEILNMADNEKAVVFFLGNSIENTLINSLILRTCGFVFNSLTKFRVVNLNCSQSFQLRENIYKQDTEINILGCEVAKFALQNQADSILTVSVDTLSEREAGSPESMKILRPVFNLTDSLASKPLAVSIREKGIAKPGTNNQYSLQISNSIINEDNWFVHFNDIQKIDDFYRINPGDSVLSRRHEVYTSIRKAYANQGKWNQADQCFYEWKEYERANYLVASTESFFIKLPKTLFHYLNWVSCGYGIKPLRIFPFAFLIILIFAIFYFVTPQPISNLEQHLLSTDRIKKKLGKFSVEKMEDVFTDYDFDFKKHKQDLIDDIISSIGADELTALLNPKPQTQYTLDYFWNCFYFSFSTFTTVGIGDWYPSGRLNKAIVMIEGSLGWLCLGLFITTYANILLR